jgi:outer membrane biosynthesis protein TonB
MDEVMAYCVREKVKKPMKDARLEITANGKYAYKGVCSSCGTKMQVFVGTEKAKAILAAQTEPKAAPAPQPVPVAAPVPEPTPALATVPMAEEPKPEPVLEPAPTL